MLLLCTLFFIACDSLYLNFYRRGIDICDDAVTMLPLRNHVFLLNIESFVIAFTQNVRRADKTNPVRAD